MGKKADFARSCVKSPDFWVRVDAIGTGVAVITEGVLLGIYLPTLPIVLGAVGAVAGAALIGCGIYSMFVGTTGTINFLKKTYTDIFNRHAAPPKPKPPSPTPLQRLARHRLLKPLVERLSKKPLVRKFLDSKVGKMRGGLTQQQRDLFMVSLNMKGSLFVGGSAAVYIALHTLALPALTLGGVVTTATAIASFYVCKSLFDISCSARVLFRHIRDNRAAKKASAAKKAAPVAAPIPSPQPTPAVAPAAPAPAFEKSAGITPAEPQQPVTTLAPPKNPATPPPGP